MSEWVPCKDKHTITELSIDDVNETIKRLLGPQHQEISIIIPANGMEEYKKLPDAMKESPYEVQHRMLQKGYVCFIDEQTIYDDETRAQKEE